MSLKIYDSIPGHPTSPMMGMLSDPFGRKSRAFRASLLAALAQSEREDRKKFLALLTSGTAFPQSINFSTHTVEENDALMNWAMGMNDIFPTHLNSVMGKIISRLTFAGVNDKFLAQGPYGCAICTILWHWQTVTRLDKKKPFMHLLTVALAIDGLVQWKLSKNSDVSLETVQAAVHRLNDTMGISAYRSNPTQIPNVKIPSFGEAEKLGMAIKGI